MITAILIGGPLEKLEIELAEVGPPPGLAVTMCVAPLAGGTEPQRIGTPVRTEIYRWEGRTSALNDRHLYEWNETR